MWARKKEREREKEMNGNEGEKKKERKKEWDRVYESRVNESKRERGDIYRMHEREQMNK